MKKPADQKLIASFAIDHNRLCPGIYVSRRDVVNGMYVTTFDVRMKHPNTEPTVHPGAMHTIEHIVATYLRNSEFADKVVYWGPMGCLTGCYFITATVEKLMPRDIEGLIRAAYRYLAGYTGEIPGAKPKNCGNWLLHDLPMAKYEARTFLAKKWKFAYPRAR